MDKKDLFIFGMILEGDIYADGFDTTKEDRELLQKALFKAYGVTENSTKEELIRLQAELEENSLKYIQEYREKIRQFIEHS